jgi:LAO/AO transport system kinase
MTARRPPEDQAAAIRRGDRRALARAITLLESTRPDQVAQGEALLDELVADTGGAIRVGITGSPGVGKSSFVEALGLHLIERGERVAVLAVDPTSPVSGGSILGDKTRMERLAQREEAFIRPSPSGGSLGGVAHRTREAMLACEAAGFGVVIVETVGVGQSEHAVASMVDVFVVLLQPGAGDELQGLKKGVLELADLLVVNKADGELREAAERTRADYTQAVGLLAREGEGASVLAASARTGEGIPEFWDALVRYRAAMQAGGALEQRRRAQAREWMWSLVHEGLRQAFRRHPGVAERIGRLEADVEARRTTAAAAARELLEAFQKP